MQVGTYRIVGEIGRGAMGVVYKAIDERFGRAVALKQLPVQLAIDPVLVKRFDREARAAAAVLHPNVVAVHEAFEDRGQRYLVVELVAGGTLDARLKREGQLSWREAARLGADIASALAAIHAAGIVHRDLKPANVLLASDGSPKLADFGLARHTSGLESQHLTAPGEVVGTLSYLPPEQIRGEAVDTPGDLYSLGVLLSRAATGDVPFRGTAVEVMEMHLRVAPPSPRAAAPDLPHDFEALILGLLAKDPAARPGAEEVSRRLASLASTPDGEAPRSRALGLLVVALAVAAVCIGAWAGRNARRARPSTPAPAVPATPSRVPPSQRTTPPGPAATSAPVVSLTLIPVEAVTSRWARPIACYSGPTHRGRRKKDDPEVVRVSFSSDGRSFVSAHDSGLARVWDVATGALVVLRGHESTCYSGAFSADGTVVVTGGTDHSVRFFSARTGKPVAHEKEIHERGVHAVASLGSAALSASPDGTFAVWDLPGGDLRYRLGDEVERGGPNDVAVLPDGETVFAGLEDGRVTLTSLGLRRRIGEARPHPVHQIEAVACAPSGLQGASGDKTGRVLAWDLSSFEYAEVGRHADRIYALAFSRDGRRLLSAGADGKLIAWDPVARLDAWSIDFGALEDSPSTIAFAPDGKTFVIGTACGRIVLFSFSGP